MKLLGPYSSQLSAFYYEQLLALVQQAFAQGDYSGNATFDSAAAQALVQQAQDFASLPVALAATTVTDEGLNTPLALLQARFLAILAENADFKAKAAALISVIKKDTVLLDQLLAAASLDSWSESVPSLGNSSQFSWDFGMGHGNTAAASDVAEEDPSNLVVYTTKPPVITQLDVADGIVRSGLAAPASIGTIGVKNLKWSFSTEGELEELYGTDWAKLTLLEPHPSIRFSSTPQVEVLLPKNSTAAPPFEVTGQVKGGSLPVQVRVLFQPRRNTGTVIAFNSLINPGFELDPAGVGWTLGSGWSVAEDGSTRTDCHVAKKDASGNGTLVSSSVHVKPGQKLFIQVFYQAVNSADGTLQLSLLALDSLNNPVLDDQGNPVVVSLPAVSPSLNYQSYEGLVTVPNNPSIINAAIQVKVTGQTTGFWYVDDARIHVPTGLSFYQIAADDVDLIGSDSRVYVDGAGADFVVNGNEVTLLDVSDNQALTARFTESFPAYQCSVNGSDWSAIVMLDPSRPYPDGSTSFPTLQLAKDSSGQLTRFPLTDELGNPLGLFIRLLTTQLRLEYLLRVTTPAMIGQLPGDTAVLEIEFERPAYMNALSLSTFTTFPMTLESVEAQDFASTTRDTVFNGQVLIDQPLVIRFPRRLVQRIFLTFFQESYTLKEQKITSADALRRDIMNRLQSVLPISVRRAVPPQPQITRGAQYEFGVEEIQGQNWEPLLPGVFVAGPQRFYGSPELVKFDADIQGVVDCYLCYRAFDSNGVEQDVELQGGPRDPVTHASLPTPSGTSLVFPLAQTLDRTKVAQTDVYIKFVSRSANALVERFRVEVSPA